MIPERQAMAGGNDKDTIKITLEATRTGSAVSTYNILLGEGRRVAAGLIAVE